MDGPLVRPADAKLAAQVPGALLHLLDLGLELLGQGAALLEGRLRLGLAPGRGLHLVQQELALLHLKLHPARQGVGGGIGSGEGERGSPYAAAHLRFCRFWYMASISFR